MKLLKQGVALAMIGAGFAAVPALQAQATPAAAKADPGIQAIKDEATGGVALRTNPATGKIGFAAVNGADADLMPGRAASTGQEAAAKADAYLAKHSATFGAAQGQLVQKTVDHSPVGWTVSYVQKYQGLDVFGSMIKANVDSDGDLIAVNGYAAPGLDLSTTPRLTPAQAGNKAVAAVRYSPAINAEGKKADLSGIAPKDAKLVVYRMGAIKGETGDTVLAYQVEVTNKANIRDMVFIDANTGKPVNRYSMANDALEREIYETSPNTEPVWVEGEEESILNEDQKKMVDSSGEAYWLFKNTFGRDSWDAAGAKMRIVNNDPRIACPNANWNGITTNYCDGVSSDDVVSHEWGHAYTQETSGLIYQFQSGALNESYSDVWGETLDLINGREDEGEGDITVKRTVGSCDPTASPALVMTINSPAAHAGPCTAAAAASGGGFSTTPVTTDVVEALDAANATGPTTQDGCTTYTNAADVAGKWAYVDRGTCTFQAKYDLAVAAGATGLVIGNNQPTPCPAPRRWRPDPDGHGLAGGRHPLQGCQHHPQHHHPGRGHLGPHAHDSLAHRREVGGLRRRDPRHVDPHLLRRPGQGQRRRVQLRPAPDRRGWRARQLWRPQPRLRAARRRRDLQRPGRHRAGPRQGGADLVARTDGLPHAVVELRGRSRCVRAVLRGHDRPADQQAVHRPQRDSGPATPIAAADCASITAAVAATEMRTPPVKCNFQPAFDANTPATCGEGFATTALYSEDFEDGLAGWATSFETAFDGGIHEPWKASTTAPTGNGDPHPGGVAYGPLPTRASAPTVPVTSRAATPSRLPSSSSRRRCGPRR